MLSWLSLSFQILIFAWKYMLLIVTTRLCAGQPENWGLVIGGA